MLFHIEEHIHIQGGVIQPDAKPAVDYFTITVCLKVV